MFSLFESSHYPEGSVETALATWLVIAGEGYVVPRGFVKTIITRT